MGHKNGDVVIAWSHNQSICASPLLRSGFALISVRAVFFGDDVCHCN